MGEEVVELPGEYQGDVGTLTIRHEEDALCWLWAYPSLLPWPNTITWLYTPVVGNTRWPGDLWGVDRNGDLLILECKQCRRADDPFRDFVAFHEDGRLELSAAHWLPKFRRHLAAELAFDDITSVRPRNRTDGILPRSNKRAHIRRWSSLAPRIGARIHSRDYEITALSSLDRRAKAHDPRPFYIALMTISNPSRPVLSAAALASKKVLERDVGEDHVVVISIRADRVSGDRARIVAAQI